MIVKLFSFVLGLASVASITADTIYTHPDATKNVVHVVQTPTKSFIGGVNYISELDVVSGNMKVIRLPYDESASTVCLNFLGPYDDELSCSNPVVLLEKYNATHLVACGVNSQSPACYLVDMQTHAITDVSYGVTTVLGYDPFVSNPALVLNEESGNPQLYSATCGSNRRCTLNRDINGVLRSPTSANVYLGINDASYSDMYPSNNGEVVFLFYRDTNNAFVNDQFVTEAVIEEYAMVAKVCSRDEGGVSLHRGKFITFMTARLICPFPGGSATGNANAYYNLLSSTFKLGDTVYGLFTLPESWGLPASAICAYNLNTVDNYMTGVASATGSISYYDPTELNTTRIYTGADSFAPGQCPSAGNPGTQTTSAQFTDVIKRTTLLREIIPPLNGKPSFITTSIRYNLIAATETGSFHCIYLLKRDGHLTKIRLDSSSSGNKKVVSETRVNKIIGNILSFSMSDQNLIIVTPTQVIKRPVANCSMHTNCRSCETDPHCEWVLSGDSLECVLDNSGLYVNASCPSAPTPAGPVTIVGSPPTLISWEASTSPSVTGYFIELLTKFNGRVTFQKILKSLQIVPTFSIGATYIVSVKAINGRAQSEASTAEFTTVMERPPINVIRIQDTSCTVAYVEVLGPSFYNITVYLNQGNSLVRTYLTPRFQVKSEQSIQITGLTPNQDYIASVFGTSPYGMKTPVAFLEFKTDTKATTTATPISPMESTSFSTSTVLSATQSDDELTVETEPGSVRPDSALNSSLPASTNASKKTQSSVPNLLFEDDIGTYLAQANGNAMVFLAVLVVFAVVAVFISIVFLQNRWSIGMGTTEIKTNEIKLKRKWLLFWSIQDDKENEVTPGKATKNGTY